MLATMQNGIFIKNVLNLVISFFILAFVEADAGGLKPNASVLEQGLAFIFNQTLNKDPYTANLVSYLLHRANHPRKDDYYKISKDLVRHENDTIHWEQISKQRPSSNITTSFKPMWREINRLLLSSSQSIYLYRMKCYCFKPYMTIYVRINN